MGETAEEHVLVTVVASNVVAIIDGSDERTVYDGSVLQLSATQSYDPHFETAALSVLQFAFELAHTSGNGSVVLGDLTQFGAGTNPSLATITVGLGNLTAGESYTFTVIARRPADTDNNYTSTDSVLLHVVGNPTLDVQLTVDNPRTREGYDTVSTGDRLVVNAALPNGEPANWTWTVPTAFVSAVRSLTLTSNVLVLDTSDIMPDTVYSFSITASRATTSGTAAITVWVNGPPTGGALQLSTAAARAFIDPVTLTSFNWTDVDLPLTYRFLYHEQDNAAVVLPLTVFTASTEYTTIFAAGAAGATFFTVVGAVADSLDARVNATALLNVSTGAGGSDVATQLTQTLDNAEDTLNLLGDAESALSHTVGAVLALKQSLDDTNADDGDDDDDDNAVATVRSRVLGIARRAANGSDVSDPAALDQIAVATQLATSIEVDTLSNGEASTAVELMSTVLGASQEQVVTLDESTAHAVFEAQGNVLQRIAAANNTVLAEQLADTMTRLTNQQADLLLRDRLSPGEADASLSTDAMELQVRELSASDVAGTVSVNLPSRATFELRTGAMGAVQDAIANCAGQNVGAAAVEWLANPYGARGLGSRFDILFSDVASLSFRDCNFTEVPIQDVFADPVDVRLPVPEDTTPADVDRFVVPDDNDTWTEWTERHAATCDRPGRVTAKAVCAEDTEREEEIQVSIECARPDEKWDVLCPAAWRTLRCVFWDDMTEAWSHDGCSVTAYDAATGELECSCSHLTDFTSAAERYTTQAGTVVTGAGDTSGADVKRNLGVVIVLGVLWLLYIVSLALGRRVDLREDMQQVEALRLRAAMVNRADGNPGLGKRWWGSRSASKRRHTDATAHQLRGMLAQQTSGDAYRGDGAGPASPRSVQSADAENSATGAAAELQPKAKNGELSPSLKSVLWSAMLEEHALLALVYYGGHDKAQGLRFRYRTTAAFCEVLTLLFVAVLLHESQLVTEEWEQIFLHREDAATVLAALLEAVWEAFITLLIYLPIHALLYRGFQRLCRARASAAQFAEILFLQRDAILDAPLHGMSVAELDSVIVRLEALRKLCKSELVMLRTMHGPHSEEARQFEQAVLLRVQEKRIMAKRVLVRAKESLEEARQAVMADELAAAGSWFARRRIHQLTKRWHEKLQAEAEHRMLLDCLTDEQRCEYVKDQLLLSSLQQRGLCGSVQASLYRTFLLDKSLYISFVDYKPHKLFILGVTVLWMLVSSAYILFFAFKLGPDSVLHALLNMVLALLLDAIVLSPLYILLARVVVPLTIVRTVQREWSEAESEVEQHLTRGGVDNGRLADLLSVRGAATSQSRGRSGSRPRRRDPSAPHDEDTAHSLGLAVTSTAAVQNVRRLSLGSRSRQSLSLLSIASRTAAISAAAAAADSEGLRGHRIAPSAGGSGTQALLFDQDYLTKRPTNVPAMHRAWTREADVLYLLAHYVFCCFFGWRGFGDDDEVEDDYDDDDDGMVGIDSAIALQIRTDLHAFLQAGHQGQQVSVRNFPVSPQSQRSVHNPQHDPQTPRHGTDTIRGTEAGIEMGAVISLMDSAGHPAPNDADAAGGSPPERMTHENPVFRSQVAAP